MCLIVDANVAHRIFQVEDDPDFGDIHRALFDFTGNITVRAVYGGHLVHEYQKAGVLSLIRALDQAGRAREVSFQLVDTETHSLRKAGLCQSNDVHVIALARVDLERVRLLCSHDKALHVDFTDKRLIDSPRGSVYQNRSHNHLIGIHCSGIAKKGLTGARPKKKKDN